MARSIAIFIPPHAHLSGLAAPTDLAQLSNGFAQARTGAETRPRTREAGAQVHCRWLSLNGAAVTLSHGQSVSVDGGISDGRRYEAIFLADFDIDDGAGLHRQLTRCAALGPWLVEQHQAGAHIAASGAAVFLLAASGLLDQRRATLPWWLQRRFRRRHPSVRLVPNLAVTEDDGLYCADSLNSLLAMTLHLMRRLTSPNSADWLVRTTQIDGGGAERLPPPPPGVEDPVVASAQYHLQQHYATAGGLGDLAQRLAVSPRTLTRRFQKALGCTPVAYIQQLRVEAAKRMLQRTPLQVEVIAQQVGYSDSAYFKKLFRRHTGLSPASWRRSHLDAPQR